MKKWIWKLEAFASHVRHGRWALLFNDFMRLIGLGRFVHLGENRFYAIEPLRRRNPDFATEPEDDFPFQLTAETDSSIIPELLACLAGSTDYAFLSDLEIIERFQGLLEEGNTVWVVRDAAKDAVAGFFWTTTGDYLVPCGTRKILLRLPNELAAVEFIFVHPDYRRRGVYFKAFNRVARHLPNTVFFCVVDAYNAASVAVHLKLGFQLSGVLRYFQFFGGHPASFRFGKTRRLFFCPKKDVPYPIDVEY